MRIASLALALLLGISGSALAAQKPGNNPESPSDGNQGVGNDPPGGAGGAPPGQTTNPNPGKNFEPGPAWLSEFVLAHHTSGSDKHGTDKPSGPSGPGQKGQPGKDGKSGP